MFPGQARPGIACSPSINSYPLNHPQTSLYIHTSSITPLTEIPTQGMKKTTVGKGIIDISRRRSVQESMARGVTLLYPGNDDLKGVAASGQRLRLHPSGRYMLLTPNTLLTHRQTYQQSTHHHHHHNQTHHTHASKNPLISTLTTHQILQTIHLNPPHKKYFQEKIYASPPRKPATNMSIAPASRLKGISLYVPPQSTPLQESANKKQK